MGEVINNSIILWVPYWHVFSPIMFKPLIMKKNKTVNLLNGESTEYKDLTDVKMQEKINKHMSDINDKITDEDIKNIRTDMYDELLRNDTDEENTEPVKNELTEEEKDKEQEKDESQKANSAWNILEDQ